MDNEDEIAKFMWKHDDKLGAYLIWAVFYNFIKLVKENDIFDLIIQYCEKTKLIYVCGAKSENIPTMALYKNAELEVVQIPDAGHIMMAENPKDFWKLVLGSLHQLP